MKNKNTFLKTIFLKRMIISAVIQFLVIFATILLIRFYYIHDKYTSIFNTVIISDAFTLEEIAKYYYLNDKYALDLELHNLTIEKKLDSINFLKKINSINNKWNCNKFKNNKYLVCRNDKNIFLGISPININNKNIGYIVITKREDNVINLPISYWFSFVFFLIICIFSFNFIFLFISIKRMIEKDTITLLNFISYADDFLSPPPVLKINEYNSIASTFVEKKLEITKLQTEKTFYEVRKNISEQVAHDIRSPLAALTILTNDDQLPFPDNTRELLRNISTRIRDIANDLVRKNNTTKNDLDDGITLNLLSPIISSVVDEKQIQLQMTPNIRLEFLNSHLDFFINLNIVEFKRMLSNLINNAIESIHNFGCITINLAKESDCIKLIISDNGIGIPQYILEKIGKKGFSYNKKSGSGLGLSHAIKTMKDLQGDLKIYSEVNKGTQITLSFPIDV